MEGLNVFIPFFGVILVLIDGDSVFPSWKGLNWFHFFGTSIVHGLIWGQILAG